MKVRKYLRTRRDMCYFIGRRMATLSPEQANSAWKMLGLQLEKMGEMDVPKYLDVVAAIRAATIAGKRNNRA